VHLQSGVARGNAERVEVAAGDEIDARLPRIVEAEVQS
jgi:hypothetical protein